jgi:hypothetical protein
MITLTGRTWDHRNVIREMGGRWNGNERVWQFYHLSDEQRTAISQMVGVTINETISPARWDWADELIDIRHIPSGNVRIGDDMTYLNHFADATPNVFGGFSSLSKFIDHVEALDVPDNRNGTCDIGWTAKPGYAGTRHMTEAIYTARNGWTDGLGLASSLLAPDPVKKRRQRAVAGGRVNVGRLLSGLPDHMVKRSPQPARKIITLFVETVMWEGIKIEVALTRVVAISAIIDRLEQQGYSCNIVAVYSARGWRQFDKSHILAVRIKEAGERLNLADVSFAFGHPSFGRRLVYAHHGCIGQTDMTHDHRGRISQAFNEDHQPRRNEFYIPQTFTNTVDIYDMLDIVTPENLPIEIKRND